MLIKVLSKRGSRRPSPAGITIGEHLVPTEFIYAYLQKLSIKSGQTRSKLCNRTITPIATTVKLQ